jgi:hypothetical protein
LRDADVHGDVPGPDVVAVAAPHRFDNRGRVLRFARGRCAVADDIERFVAMGAVTAEV